MNTPSNAVPGSDANSRGIVAPAMPGTRPMYWSVRRELWESRSIYIAPLVVMALVVFGSLISMVRLTGRIGTLPAHDPAVALIRAFSIAPAPIMLATFVVGVFYSLDALYGERRDRTILFWKSLPVSDLTTVLSKASIPLVVLPLIAFVLSVATLGIMLVLGTAILLASGLSPATLWAEVHFFQEPLIMIYGLTVHALWFAPIYAWLLLVSAWARRTPVLWAALPPFAVAVVERIAFSTSHFCSLLRYRVTGALEEAFGINTSGGGVGHIEQISQLTTVRFLTSPGLWIGLVFAAAFLVAAVRLRRYREPI